MANAINDVLEEEIVADPQAYFDAPSDVIDAPLTLETKQRILESWELDARRLEESADENMSGGEPSLLHAVSQALRRVDAAIEGEGQEPTHEAGSFSDEHR